MTCVMIELKCKENAYQYTIIFTGMFVMSITAKFTGKLSKSPVDVDIGQHRTKKEAVIAKPSFRERLEIAIIIVKQLQSY